MGAAALTAGGVRVVVRPGPDDEVDRRRVAMRRRNHRAFLAGLPVLLACFVAFQLIKSALAWSGIEREDLNLLVVAVWVPVMAWQLWRQRRRAARHPGALWSSRRASYPGPYDDEPLGGGLSGSAALARLHRAPERTPTVRLVLTPESLAVVPDSRRNGPLVLPLEHLRRVDLVTGDSNTCGIRLETTDGRQATFLVQPEPAFAVELQRLGATVERR